VTITDLGRGPHAGAGHQLDAAKSYLAWLFAQGRPHLPFAK